MLSRAKGYFPKKVLEKEKEEDKVESLESTTKSIKKKNVKPHKKPKEVELGAQALLQLGTKKEDDEKSSNDSDNENTTNVIKQEKMHEESEPVQDGQDPTIPSSGSKSIDENFTESPKPEPEQHSVQESITDNEQSNSKFPNETVEAAVMRYVGGTLDGESGDGNPDDISAQSQKKRNYENISNLMQNWPEFLDSELGSSSSPTHNNGNHSNSSESHDNTSNNQSSSSTSVNNFEINNVFTSGDATQPAHKKRRSGTRSRRVDSTVSNVDPELANMDGGNELIHAAVSQLINSNSLSLGKFLHDNQPTDGDNNVVIKSNTSNNHHDLDGPDPQQVATEASNLSKLDHHNSSNDWITTNASTPTGKVFSKQEMAIIDNVIQNYCQLHGLSRQQICERIWANDRKKDDFWESILLVLPNRTRASLYKHVRRSYHIFQVRGKWTEEEDQQLGALVSEKSSKWKLIGDLMGRMPEDCRDRWRNYVKCGNKRASNKWSEHEELSLKQVIEEWTTLNPEEPINWTIISERMGGTRSRIQCRYKWNKFLKKEALVKVREMTSHEKFWILSKLRESNYESQSEVDWDNIASIDPRGIWCGKHLQVAFDQMVNMIKDHKKKSFQEILAQLSDTVCIVGVDDILALQQAQGQEEDNHNNNGSPPQHHEQLKSESDEVVANAVAVASAAQYMEI